MEQFFISQVKRLAIQMDSSSLLMGEHPSFKSINGALSQKRGCFFVAHHSILTRSSLFRSYFCYNEQVHKQLSD